MQDWREELAKRIRNFNDTAPIYSALNLVIFIQEILDERDREWREACKLDGNVNPDIYDGWNAAIDELNERIAKL